MKITCLCPVGYRYNNISCSDQKIMLYIIRRLNNHGILPYIGHIGTCGQTYMVFRLKKDVGLNHFGLKTGFVFQSGLAFKVFCLQGTIFPHQHWQIGSSSKIFTQMEAICTNFRSLKEEMAVSAIKESCLCNCFWKKDPNYQTSEI